MCRAGAPEAMRLAWSGGSRGSSSRLWACVVAQGRPQGLCQTVRTKLAQNIPEHKGSRVRGKAQTGCCGGSAGSGSTALLWTADAVRVSGHRSQAKRHPGSAHASRAQSLFFFV